jgi:hypothetical protein
VIFDAINSGDLSVLDELVRPDGVGVDAVHGPGTAGRPYRMQTVHIYRSEGALLAEPWGVRDELAARVQLGVLPAPEPTVH